MFRDAKVGDEVWSAEDGCGIIVEAIASNIYPLTVQFDHCKTRFTLEGKRCISSKNPTLFWGEIKFEVPKKPKNSLPILEVDTKVLVRNIKGGIEQKRYFKKFTEHGRIVCFVKGATSWSSNGTDYEWSYWELAEDNTQEKEEDEK